MARRVGYAARDQGRMEANASGMIYAKCGTPNTAGDAFCGSRGAYLVFAAEEAGAPEVGAAGNPRPPNVTILDWYPAKKTPTVGSPTTQAAISEIRLYGILVTP
jgi:hypothetical protein